MLKHAENTFERCHICGSIAEYSELVGTNPQDVERILYCAAHAEDHMDQEELDEHRIEIFDAMVKVTFEWASAGKEVRIPLGFTEAQEGYKRMWANYAASIPLKNTQEED